MQSDFAPRATVNGIDVRQLVLRAWSDAIDLDELLYLRFLRIYEAWHPENFAFMHLCRLWIESLRIFTDLDLTWKNQPNVLW